MNNCNNHGSAISGKFCKDCGQKAKVGELTFSEVGHETWHPFTHTDTGILKLMRDMLIRSKAVYTNYFSGQRTKYLSPVTFF